MSADIFHRKSTATVTWANAVIATVDMKFGCYAADVIMTSLRYREFIENFDKLSTSVQRRCDRHQILAVISDQFSTSQRRRDYVGDVTTPYRLSMRRRVPTWIYP